MKERGGIGIAILGLDAGHAEGLPLLFAGPLVVGDQVASGGLFLQVGQRILHANGDHQVVPQDRAVGVAPPDGVRPMFLLKIAQPKLFSGEIVGGQVAVAEMDEDQFAVGDGRGTGHVVEVVKRVQRAFGAAAPHGAGADLARPFDGAVGLANFEEQELFALLSGQEDGIAPDGRGAGALIGQRTFPGDAGVLAPLGG